MKNTTTGVPELIRKGFEARRKGDSSIAKEHLWHALAEARRLKDFQGEANILLELSAVIRESDNDYETARKLIEDSLKIYTKIKNNAGRAYAICNMGSLALDEKNYDSALKSFKEALAIFEKSPNKFGMGMTLHQMGKTERHQKDWIPAEQHLRRSLLIFEGLGDKFAAAQALMSLAGLALDKNNDREFAKQMLIRAKTLLESIGNVAAAESIQRMIVHIEGKGM